MEAENVRGSPALDGFATDRVRLRALRHDDLAILRSFVNDPEVMRFSNAFRPISEIEQDQWWERILQSRDMVWFGVEELEGKAPKLVGTCCLVDIDPIVRQAELRIRIGAKESWGHGLGTGACALLVGYGFDHLNLQRIWLRVFASNPRAIRLYEKLGFATEGRPRRAAFIAGEADDVVLMGLLREEWAGAPGGQLGGPPSRQ